MAVTLKQIADAAGVSRGTVDRVLHGRGHVNPDVEERILRLAGEMNYEPNTLARGLVKSSRATKIGVICQFSDTPFMELVLAGVQAAAAELRSMGAEVLLETIRSYDQDRLPAAMDRMMEEGVQGLALTPGQSPETAEKMRAITAAGIPVITFNTDAAATGRLCYVGQDNYRAGETCAFLMGSCLPKGGLVLTIPGYLDHPAHSLRQKAFRDRALEQFPSIGLLYAGECCDKDDIAAELVRDTLHAHPELAGVYLSGNGQVGACRALREAGRDRDVKVIGYDLTEQNVQELRSGAMDFLIDQNAGEQGYRPARLLYDYLILGRKPEREFFYTDIIIKTRYNL